LRVAYQSADNDIARRIVWTPIVPEYAPTLRLRFPFPRQSLRAVRIVQTGSGTHDLWNLHEVRILDGDRELDRAPRWRLTAVPYPWGIQNAFDNSLLTFWVCGEWIRPGQFVRVDFGAPETADAVELQTAPNQGGVRVKLEGQTANGDWQTLAAQPQVRSAPRPLGLARAAAEELKRRGIDYLLFFDTELGAPEIQRDVAVWGLREVGRYRQATLYKLP
jgi:hypothetical protein